jgi:hypothetical protein
MDLQRQDTGSQGPEDNMGHRCWCSKAGQASKDADAAVHGRMYPMSHLMPPASQEVDAVMSLSHQQSHKSQVRLTHAAVTVTESQVTSHKKAPTSHTKHEHSSMKNDKNRCEVLQQPLAPVPSVILCPHIAGTSSTYW